MEDPATVSPKDAVGAIGEEEAHERDEAEEAQAGRGRRLLHGNRDRRRVVMAEVGGMVVGGGGGREEGGGERSSPRIIFWPHSAAPHLMVHSTLRKH